MMDNFDNNNFGDYLRKNTLSEEDRKLNNEIEDYMQAYYSLKTEETRINNLITQHLEDTVYSIQCYALSSARQGERSMKGFILSLDGIPEGLVTVVPIYMKDVQVKSNNLFIYGEIPSMLPSLPVKGITHYLAKDEAQNLRNKLKERLEELHIAFSISTVSAFLKNANMTIYILKLEIRW